MAYSKFEQAYVDTYMDAMYPMEPAQPEQPDTMLAAAPTAEPQGQVSVSGFTEPQVATDAPQGFGVARPIPQNKAQEALGYLGELLTKAGVQLDKVGIDIPVLGRVSLKDLTVGESGKVLEDAALGFYPIEGAGGFISGTTRIKPDPAMELLNIAPAAAALAKVGGKAAIKGVTKAVGATKNMPVGMSTKAVGQGVDELGFYSAAKQAVNAIQQPKGTGQQFLKQIEKTPGVKPDEIKWTGLDEFLQSKKSVTKAEVQEYLDKNRVEIKEVQMGSGANPYPYRTADEWQGAIDRAEKVGDFDESERLTNAWEAFEGLGIDDQTKFSKYTLPGGENYREILLTLPAKEVPVPTGLIVRDGKDAEYPFAIMVNGKEVNRVDSMEFADEILQDEIRRATSKVDKAAQFKSSHFDQPNILAHMRVNDRVDADGKKVLFVEEVQSDWHQAGRKKGYKGDITEAAKEYTALLKEWGNKLASATPKEVTARLNELRPIVAKNATEAVPDAPFKGNWHELAMKRAIQMASEGGYDRIAFTTGKTQAERFDLSKQIDELLVTKNSDGTFNLEATMPNGGGTRTVGEEIQADKLDDIVGKDLANMIRKQESKGDVYSADDLRVGGEGMKGFYDDILPKFLDKYAKKWDAKTGMTEIKTGQDKVERGMVAPGIDFVGEDKITKAPPVSVHYIDITPKMRESVVTKGQPMFAIGAGGAGAAATQEENK